MAKFFPAFFNEFNASFAISFNISNALSRNEPSNPFNLLLSADKSNDINLLFNSFNLPNKPPLIVFNESDNFDLRLDKNPPFFFEGSIVLSYSEAAFEYFLPIIYSPFIFNFHLIIVYLNVKNE